MEFQLLRPQCLFARENASVLAEDRTFYKICPNEIKSEKTNQLSHEDQLLSYMCHPSPVGYCVVVEGSDHKEGGGQERTWGRTRKEHGRNLVGRTVRKVPIWLFVI